MEGVTGTLIGKQCYIAPEQLRGKPSVQSDIYSFGCTLYFLLAGKDPSALEPSDLALSGVQVRPLLNKLIARCTQFDSDNRYHSFDEIIKDIKSASVPETTHLKLIPKKELLPTKIELDVFEHG